jgi:hypothetical protein
MASASIAFNCDLVSSLGWLTTGLRVDTTLMNRASTGRQQASSSKIGERSETAPCCFISSSPGFWLPSYWPRPARHTPRPQWNVLRIGLRRLDSRKRGRAGDIRLGIVCIAPVSDLIRRTRASSCSGHGQEDNVRFVLLIGCLSLSACAALVTMRLPNLHRKVAHFLPPRRRLTAPRQFRALD